MRRLPFDDHGTAYPLFIHEDTHNHTQAIGLASAQHELPETSRTTQTSQPNKHLQAHPADPSSDDDTSFPIYQDHVENKSFALYTDGTSPTHTAANSSDGTRTHHASSWHHDHLQAFPTHPQPQHSRRSLKRKANSSPTPSAQHQEDDDPRAQKNPKRDISIISITDTDAEIEVSTNISTSRGSTSIPTNRSNNIRKLTSPPKIPCLATLLTSPPAIWIPTASEIWERRAELRAFRVPRFVRQDTAGVGEWARFERVGSGVVRGRGGGRGGGQGAEEDVERDDVEEDGDAEEDGEGDEDYGEDKENRVGGGGVGHGFVADFMRSIFA